MSQLDRRARKARRLKRLINWYPPYLGAGIRVESLSDDFRHLRVRMRLRWYNRNYVGTQFGGSLYAMTDPFYMLLLIELLGPDYIVWDKAAAIDFIKPGQRTVHAEFNVDDAMLEDIRQHTAAGDKYFMHIPVEIRDDQGELIARVDKTVYIRLKPEARPAH